MLRLEVVPDLQGKWLREVGDHPVVWVSAKSSMDGGMAAQGSRPVMPAKWDHRHKHYFGNVVEVCCSSNMTGAQWLHQYRECIVAVNKMAGEGPRSIDGVEEHQTVQCWLARAAHGLDSEESQRLQLKVSMQYWQLALQEWGTISGRGLEGNTLKTLRLQTTSPMLPMHKIYDSDRQVFGRDVLSIAPRECAKKFKASTQGFSSQ